mmetsp:Transcript_8508/g.19950  ORF Transcript_8508/g.19950 Transcript_8508/m.19950 type:complete len:288 (+) Transcript_8508:1041-1904(+)
MTRRTEHVSMHQLPTEFLHILCLFLIRRQSVVPAKVTPQVPHKNGGNHSRQHDHDDQAVRDAQPVNLRGNGVVHTQVNVPTRRPMQILVLLPNDIISEKNTSGCRLGIASTRVHHFISGVLPAGNLGVAAFNGILDVGHLKRLDGSFGEGVVIVVSARLEVVLDAEGLHGESNYSGLARVRLYVVILDFNVDMIVYVCLLRILGDKANGKSLPVTRRHRRFVLDLARGRDVVHDPIVVIVFANGTHELVRRNSLLFSSPEVRYAQLFTEHVDFHREAVGRRFDTVAC